MTVSCGPERQREIKLVEAIAMRIDNTVIKSTNGSRTMLVVVVVVVIVVLVDYVSTSSVGETKLPSFNSTSQKAARGEAQD
jgi:hypothetical protein